MKVSDLREKTVDQLGEELEKLKKEAKKLRTNMQKVEKSRKQL